MRQTKPKVHIARSPEGQGSRVLTWVDDAGRVWSTHLPVGVDVSDESRPFDVTFVLDVDEHDAIVVDSLTVSRRVGGRPVTASAVRYLPLAEWQAAAVSAASSCTDRVVVRPATVEAHASVVEGDPYGPWRVSPGTAKAVRMTDAVLDSVAQAYRCAAERGDDPTNTVSDVFRKPRSTAGRWVMEARRRGFLEPA